MIVSKKKKYLKPVNLVQKRYDLFRNVIYKMYLHIIYIFIIYLYTGFGIK